MIRNLDLFSKIYKERGGGGAPSVDGEVLCCGLVPGTRHGMAVLTRLGVTVTAMQMMAGNFLPPARLNSELNSFSQQPVSLDLL